MDRQPHQPLIPTGTHFWHTNASDTWFEPFNQATFFNYDPNSSLLVNNFPIPAAQIVGGVLYPTNFKINLNAGEINPTKMIIDINGSATANCWIVYTQYLGLEHI